MSHTATRQAQGRTVFTLPSPFSEDFNRRRDEARRKKGFFVPERTLGEMNIAAQRTPEGFEIELRRQNKIRREAFLKRQESLGSDVANDPGVRQATVAVDEAMARGNKQDIFLAMARLGLIQKQVRDRQRQAGVISRAANVAIGQQVAQAQGQFQSSAGRRGLAFSGVEQAGIQAINAAGAGQVASTVAGAQAELFEAQRRELEAFDQGVFNFTTGLFTMAQQAKFQQQILQFQHGLIDNNDWQFWSELGGSIASLAILAIML